MFVLTDVYVAVFVRDGHDGTDMPAVIMEVTWSVCGSECSGDSCKCQCLVLSLAPSSVAVTASCHFSRGTVNSRRCSVTNVGCHVIYHLARLCPERVSHPSYGYQLEKVSEYCELAS